MRSHYPRQAEGIEGYLHVVWKSVVIQRAAISYIVPTTKCQASDAQWMHHLQAA